MRFRKVVDASAELGSLHGERGPSQLEHERKPAPRGARAFLLVVGCTVVAGMGAMTWKAWQVQQTAGAEAPKTAESVTVGSRLPPLSLPPPTPATPPPPVVAPDASPATKPTMQMLQQPPNPTLERDLLRERRLTSPLGASGTVDTPQSAPGALTPPGQGPLADKLQPMRLRPSTAGLQANRDLLITQGTSIDCVLQARIVSTQPGLVVCHLTRDVYSATGRVVLLDSGSKVTGFYEGGITQGQGRIFVQWSRIETPLGVGINVDSAGAGPLGEAGLGGYVDRHTAERFGGAILISLIGDVGNWLSNRSSGSDNIQFNTTSQGAEAAATEALRNSVNIPPTLYKHQGERVSIMVARDLDFSGVYRLEHQSAP